MVQTPTTSLTLEDFLQQPETKPASEYIDGQVIQKPMPQADHSILQGSLSSAINSQLKETKKGFAFPELQCTFGNYSMVPDIAVLSWELIPRNEVGRLVGDFLAAPDWTIEILSPEQSQTEVVNRIKHSLAHGTQMGWLIDPKKECVSIHTPNHRAALYKNAEDSLPVPEFATAFQLTVGELVAWLYE